MTTTTPVEVTQPSYLEMSDEELMKLGSPSEETPVVEAVEEVEVVAEVPVETVEEAADEVVETTPVAEPVVEKADPVAPGEPVVKTEPVKEAAPEVAVDYKAAYEKLFTPFKANGKDIAIANVDDAISLMQMGANYNKKMAALKPNLKLMKLLENNGLLSEEKIGFLIDLDKKNPDAISKLIKDSGADPMDLDAEKASGYKPNTYTVDDREIELDTVLDEIQGTSSYNRTLEIVSTKWDGPSKQVIADTPRLLTVINGHVQSGIYDTIIKEVERERMFGRLSGLSDIEAYRQVGDAIQSRGGFDHLSTQVQPKPIPVPVVPPKPRVDEEKLRDKKRAASSTKPTGSTVVKDFNPLAMSDDEFSKQVNSKYL